MFSQSTAQTNGKFTVNSCGRRSFVLDERCLGPPMRRLSRPAKRNWIPVAVHGFPRNPAAHWGEGYCVNHLMVPWLNYDDILDRQRSYDLVRFKNEVLGLSSTTGDQVVTRAELEACCGEIPMANSLSDISPRATASSWPASTGAAAAHPGQS